MALNNNFYSEILERETYWLELAHKKLLNIYYLIGKDGIKDFYERKKELLENEYNQTNNKIQKQFLDIIINIINQINILTTDYREGKNIDINLLTDLFLCNQMNNNLQKEKPNNLDKVQTQKRVLNSLRDMYTKENQDRLYDDFDEEIKSLKI